MTLEAAEKPENGDVYDGSGAHIGSVETYEGKNIQELLTIEVLYNGQWFSYKLHDVYKAEETSAQG